MKFIITCLLIVFNFSMLLAQQGNARITQLLHTAASYYGDRDFATGDSLQDLAKFLANEQPTNPIFLKTYFENIVFQTATLNNEENYNRNKHFIEEALKAAVQNKSVFYQAIAHQHLARLYGNNSQSESAMQEANMAFAKADESGNDSLKIATLLESGNIYLQQKKYAEAYTFYSRALNLAQKTEDVLGQSMAHQAFASVYLSLQNILSARSNLIKALDISKKHALLNQTGNIYIDLANTYESRQVAASEYLTKAIEIGKQNNLPILTNRAYRNLFIYYQAGGEAAKAFELLNTNAHLKKIYSNNGPGYIDWIKAEVFRYSNQLDSSTYYFEKARPYFMEGYHASSKRDFINELAENYAAANKTTLSLENYHLLYKLEDSIGNEEGKAEVAQQLSNLYKQQGNYKLALDYNSVYRQYAQTHNQSRSLEIARMEFDNSLKEQSWIEQKRLEEEHHKHNIQNLGITLAICGLFLLLLLMGFFTVSQRVLRFAGIFSFICLFEFIIMVLDHKIVDITHGQPLYIWLIKIVLISLLAPIHHWLEHKVLHYLASKKLLDVRKHFSFKNIFRKKVNALAEVDATSNTEPKPSELS